jgi:hypothetical protein
MRILLGFLCMGVITAIAVVLAAVQLLIKLLPLLVVAGLVVVAVRAWERRGGPFGVVAPPVAQPPAIRQAPQTQTQTQPLPLGGWVLVPVWMDAAGRPQLHRPVIDGEVITGEADRRG